MLPLSFPFLPTVVELTVTYELLHSCLITARSFYLTSIPSQ
jgi:hypothetical protein